MKEKKNSNAFLLTLVIILTIITLGLLGYIVYDKFYFDDKNTTNSKNENTTKDPVIYDTFNIGDKVKVKLSDSETMDFYVLKNSSDTESTLILFAEKNLGYSAFQEDHSNGNEYKNSLIESKVTEITSSWSNIISARLITVDEIKNTGLISIRNENHCVGGTCYKDYIYINKDSFLLYPREDATNSTESFWTMTKVPNSYETGETDNYVYFVDLSGMIEQHIVGYKVGSPENPTGNSFKYFGVRPVIEISKEFIIK